MEHMEQDTEHSTQQEHTLAQESAQATITGINKNDGSLVITFDDQHLMATADFYPPVGNGEPLTPDYIASMLEKLSIVYGIKWDTIQDTVLECNLNKKIIKGVVIAQGDAPSEEIPEYNELDPLLKTQTQMPSTDIPRIDYKSISSFVVVKKDQLLAKDVPRTPGQEGKDIHGNSIPPPVHRHETVIAGKNTKQQEDGIIATVAGRLICNGNELIVDEILELKSNVGY